MKRSPGSGLILKNGEPAVKESERIVMFSENKKIYIHNYQAKGLCAHCDSRENCSIPKIDGGIWHCEEYK